MGTGGGTIRRPQRWLAGHAVAIGIGWLPFVLAVAVAPGLERGGAVPDAVVGAAALVAAVFAVPPVWPLAILLGWYEGGLAERAALGDAGALRTGARLVRAVGLAFASVAAGAAAVGWLGRDLWWEYREAVVWAWTGPAVVAAAHLALARALGDRRTHADVRTDPARGRVSG